MPNKYKSSILKHTQPGMFTLHCSDNNPDCIVCKFIDGSYSRNTLLRVIEILDNALHNAEVYNRNLQT